MGLKVSCVFCKGCGILSPTLTHMILTCPPPPYNWHNYNYYKDNSAIHNTLLPADNLAKAFYARLEWFPSWIPVGILVSFMCLYKACLGDFKALCLNNFCKKRFLVNIISQFISCLLLLSLRVEQIVTVEVVNFFKYQPFILSYEPYLLNYLQINISDFKTS